MGILEALQQLRDDVKTWVTNNLNVLNTKIEENTITVDDELSESSENPVQNKVIAEALNNAKAIIDVAELPTENIRDDVYYRVLSGSLVFQQEAVDIFPFYVVNNLPDVGEPAFTEDFSSMSIYYSVQDNECYGYIDDILMDMLGLPVGWYTMESLAEPLEFPWDGILSDPSEGSDGFGAILKYVIYSYKNGWNYDKVIGWVGTGIGAEKFNVTTNDASGSYSHAEGYETIASGEMSHAEGCETIASGDMSHAEGNGSHAEGTRSHAEGSGSYAKGSDSHAEGNDSHAKGMYSHAEGLGSRAIGDNQHVQGKYNIADERYAHIVGNGMYDNGRSNAHTLDWDGNAWFAGDVYVGGSSLINSSAKKLATEDYVQSYVDEAILGGEW